MSRTLAALFTMLAVAVGAGAAAQDRPRRVPVEPLREDPPIPSVPVAASAHDDARQLQFHRGLDAAASAARVEAQIDEARRHAPFDLDWGLQ